MKSKSHSSRVKEIVVYISALECSHKTTTADRPNIGAALRCPVCGQLKPVTQCQPTLIEKAGKHWRRPKTRQL